MDIVQLPWTQLLKVRCCMRMIKQLLQLLNKLSTFTYQWHPHLHMISETGEDAPALGVDIHPSMLLHEALERSTGIFLQKLSSD